MSLTEMRTVLTERGERLRARRAVMASLDSASAEALRDVVRVDALTGAYSRDAGLVIADRAEFLTLCDLDGFKSVNDTHGHSAGDVVLVTIAHRLRQLGTVVRLGGDEFLLCTSAEPDPVYLELLISAPIALDMHGTAVAVGLSAGTVRQADHPGSVDDALSAADALMYSAKLARKQDRRERTR